MRHLKLSRPAILTFVLPLLLGSALFVFAANIQFIEGGPHRYVIGFSITILAVLVLHMGCQQDGGNPSHPSDQSSDVKSRRTTAEVTVGGKTWKIDPNRTYRATGVWINPNPRPLTATERTRLIVVQAEIETLSTRLEQLSNEADYLETDRETGL